MFLFLDELTHFNFIFYLSKSNLDDLFLTFGKHIKKYFFFQKISCISN